MLAALLERVAATGQMLGRAGVSIGDLAQNLLTSTTFSAGFCRVLDDYIETHTHGPIHLASDAHSLLLDPSYQNTPTGAHLRQAAQRYGLHIIWHTGSRLSLGAFPTLAASAHGRRRWQTFLVGGDAERLAARVISHHSPDGEHLTAAAIGAATVVFQRDPDAWRDWGAPDPSLTTLKDLWRILAAHGEPF